MSKNEINNLIQQYFNTLPISERVHRKFYEGICYLKLWMKEHWERKLPDNCKIFGYDLNTWWKKCCQLIRRGQLTEYQRQVLNETYVYFPVKILTDDEYIDLVYEYIDNYEKKPNLKTKYCGYEIGYYYNQHHSIFGPQFYSEDYISIGKEYYLDITIKDIYNAYYESLDENYDDSIYGLVCPALL